MRCFRSSIVLLGVLVLATGCASEPESAAPVPVRVATYNIEDVRTLDVKNLDQPRLRAAAALIQHVRPDVLLVNEVTYDQPGDPGYAEGDTIGFNGQRFADTFLAVSQGEGLAPIRYRAYMPPTNTGLASGFDLDNSGAVVTTYPPPPPTQPDGSPGPQTDAGRAYGNDAWGFGTFPGQYGMALLVREDLTILGDSIRTFQTLPWSQMPDARLPRLPDGDLPWYDDDEAAQMRLSSKTHADVPVQLADGTVLHLLISHPTPPAFDGPEQRNQRRNADEIRLWADYLSGADYIVDDVGVAGGFASDAPFVIMGDLNADPDEGSAYGNPIATYLLDHPRIDGTFVPVADSAGRAAYPDLDPDDTAQWGLRVDYVLPSENLTVRDGAIARPLPGSTIPAVSDHFMVWLDVVPE